jgi:release factor glutamine methyltransferase
VSTVADLVERGARRVEAGGSTSPRLDAELLLAHVLDVDRTGVLANPLAIVGEGAEARFDLAIERRVAGEPVAYIIGVREFYGLAFTVDRRALVPRPETERLVELAADEIVRRLTVSPRPPGTSRLRIVDVGTGSGAVAVALAVTLRKRGMADEVEIAATDISAEAIEVAVENAVGHGVADRIEFWEADLLPPLAGTRYDIVVSNLPYVTTAELDGAGPALSHEPRQALDGGRDGTSVIERLVEELPGGLAPGGTALLEIGAGQAATITGLVTRILPRAPCAVEADLAGVPRVVRIGPVDR